MEDFKVRPHRDEKEKKTSTFIWLVLAVVVLLGAIWFWWYYSQSIAAINQDASASLFINLDKIHELAR